MSDLTKQDMHDLTTNDLIISLITLKVKYRCR